MDTTGLGTAYRAFISPSSLPALNPNSVDPCSFPIDFNEGVLARREEVRT